MSQPAQLRLEAVAIADFRNLHRVELSPAARVNIIAGDNGQGKTSILEALYFLATSRSFRTSRLGDLVRHGCSSASVRGRFREHCPEQSRLPRRQNAAISEGKRILRVDDNPPESLRQYAVLSPVVIFEPGQTALSHGPASTRRLLLDRIALYTQPDFGMHRTRYGHALRARGRLLARSAEHGASSSAELDAFESLLASHGAALTQGRRKASEQLGGQLGDVFEHIAAASLRLAATYRSGGSESAEQASEALCRNRASDARRKATGFGPHRDDLELRLDGHPARVVGSQGQHRAVALALKVAELRCIAEARGVEPLLLLDDVSSELDADRTRALFALLATAPSQIFLSTTRPELISTADFSGSERQDLVVERGVVGPP